MRKIFTTAEDLILFSQVTVHNVSLSHEEAQAILDIHDGHAYLIGMKDDKLVRIDTCDIKEPRELEKKEVDEFVLYEFEFYRFSELIESAVEWCSELKTHQQSLCNENPENLLERESLNELNKMEAILDGVFFRTPLWLPHYS